MPPALTKTINTRTPNPSGHDGAQADRFIFIALVTRTVLIAFA
jgi:hypothetical protein